MSRRLCQNGRGFCQNVLGVDGGGDLVVGLGDGEEEIGAIYSAEGFGGRG